MSTRRALASGAEATAATSRHLPSRATAISSPPAWTSTVCTSGPAKTTQPPIGCAELSPSRNTSPPSHTPVRPWLPSSAGGRPSSSSTATTTPTSPTSKRRGSPMPSALAASPSTSSSSLTKSTASSCTATGSPATSTPLPSSNAFCIPNLESDRPNTYVHRRRPRHPRAAGTPASFQQLQPRDRLGARLHAAHLADGLPCRRHHRDRDRQPPALRLRHADIKPRSGRLDSPQAQRRAPLRAQLLRHRTHPREQ